MSDLVLPNIPTLAQIQALQSVIGEQEQVECPVTNHFAEGIYMREVFIPADSVVIGKMHRTQHYSILLSGDITVWTEGGMKRMQAPQIILSQPGCKRAAYAHTDCRWLCVHATEETDLDALEHQIIEPEGLLESENE